MEYARRILQSLKLVATDETLAQRNAAVNPTFPQQERASISTNRNEAVLPFERGDKLQEFRLLVGIMSDNSFRAPRGFDVTQRPTVTIAGRPAPNVGVYVMVVDNEVKAKQSFKFFSKAINGCLGLQLIVAAALTALGAAGHGRAGVVVLGAINTVIAGFLTYLKGSGLPNRLKYFQHEWDRVRAYIEARERDLMCADDAFDIYEQIEIIRRMYEGVKADVEQNTPDRFVGSTRQHDMSAIHSKAPATNSTGSPAGETYGDVNGKLSRTASSMSGHLGTARKPLDGDVERTGDFEKETMHNTNRTGSRIHDFGVRFSDQARGMREGEQDRVRELGDLEKHIESHGTALLRQREAAKAQEAESLRRDLASGGNRIMDDHDSEIERLQREIEEKSKSIAGLRASQLLRESERGRTGSEIAPDVVTKQDTYYQHGSSEN